MIKNINNSKFTSDIIKTKVVHFKNFWLKLVELYDLNVFISYIISNMNVRTEYQILIKMRYNSDEFATLGYQFNFSYNNYDDLWAFNEFNDVIRNRLSIILDYYNLNTTNVVLLQVLYREVVYGELKKFKTNALKSIMAKNQVTKINKTSEYFPPTLDITIYGKPLETPLNGKVSSLFVKNIDSKDKYIEFIKKNIKLKDNSQQISNSNQNIANPSNENSFYLKDVGRTNIIISHELESVNKYTKKAFTLSGNLLGEVQDTIENSNTIIRKSGAFTFQIKDNSIVFVDKQISLPPVKKEHSFDADVYKTTIIEDVRIGTIDVETYKVNNLAKVYAIGFYTNLDSKPITYYIEDTTLNSDKIILKCINEMLRSKYEGITFYAHNFGKFDCVFILKALLEYNQDLEAYKAWVEVEAKARAEAKLNNSEINSEINYSEDVPEEAPKDTSKDVPKDDWENKSPYILINNTDKNPYVLKTICRDDIILKLLIKRSVKGVMHTLTILDSYRILTNNLSDLCIKYKVDINKGIFPYGFSTKENLFYIGETPKKYYYNLSVTNDEYNSLKKDLWDFKVESLIYLNDDLISLYKVLENVNRSLFLDFNIKMTKCLTISKMAFKIYCKDYLSESKPIPYVINKGMYKDIKLGYYGGNTEVYKPYGENLYYYDVNSLYPYVSLNDMVGLECNKYQFIDTKAKLSDLFGFFYCDIEVSKDKYIGILPYRTKDGIIFPLGKWSGMYFSEELKFAEENGYVIKVKWGYNFNRVSNVFTDYVNNLYAMKSNPKNVTQKSLAKSLLNNFIGRFGMDINKPISEIVNNETFNEISLTKKVFGFKKITDNAILVTHGIDINESICTDFNLDFLDIIKNSSDKNLKNYNTTFKGVSIPIAAAVTSYGRIHITKIKNQILKKGGLIYYSDTDSIVTNIELPQDMVDPKVLGKLKLEHKIKRGYFITSKTYCLIDQDKQNSVYIKAPGLNFDYGAITIISKGINSESINESDYVEMLKGNEVTGLKTSSTTNYYEGSVLIKDIPVKLYPESYTKRSKIYKDVKSIQTSSSMDIAVGLWVDTKPLIL